MDNATLVLGPPGCGKTHYLIGEMEKALEQGVLPHQIIFVSFTRKAANEAAERACARFNLERKDFPFLRTLHSMGYNGLGLQRTDVMSSDDYKNVGRELGLVLDSTTDVDPYDAQPIPPISGNGNVYLAMIYRARYRCVSLEQEFNESRNYDISYELLVKMHQVLELYKQAHLKFDFVDLIEKYVDLNDPPYSKLLIVDEAQDLTFLQWKMVRLLASNSERVLIAGDDDQAIYGWAGASVRDFIESCPNKILLNQSYRLPKKVWELSQQVVSRIEGRIKKEFLPREEEGVLSYHSSYHTIPFNNGETWTVMCRINKYVKEFAKILMDEGYVYMTKGRSSINQEVAKAILLWRRLQNGGSLYLREVLDLYKKLPKQGPRAALRRGATNLLDAADPERQYFYADLSQNYGLVASIEEDALDVIRMSDEDRIYIAAAERRGADISKPPKINLSTFHAMKGGEDRNCVVYLGTTKVSYEGNVDDELRALYVAITRSKYSLHLLDTNKRYRIDI